MFFTISSKNVIADLLFFRGGKKDASSEQILKNLLGRDHSGFLFFFLSFLKENILFL